MLPLASPKFTNSPVSMNFRQRSPDLSADFSSVTSNLTGPAGPTSDPDPTAVGGGPYFYRAGALPSVKN